MGDRFYTNKINGINESGYRKERFFGDRLGVTLPASFSALSASEAATFFLYEKKPQVVLSDGGQVFFSMSILEQALGTGEVLSAAEGIIRHLRQRYPGQVSKQPIICRNEAIPICRFTLFLPGAVKEGDKNHELFVFSFERKFALGSLSYPAVEKGRWQSCLRFMLESFEWFK
ncbi:MAG: hypothetical protein LBV33_03915 [Lachnospiraceae bacterium]|jgi:hypothetical protein|nr:hypothetical protein [Lachnospiraceae bacterium]